MTSETLRPKKATGQSLPGTGGELSDDIHPPEMDVGSLHNGIHPPEMEIGSLHNGIHPPEMEIGSLHNGIHPPEMEIKPVKTTCGCPCGGSSKRSQTQSLRKAFVTECTTAYTG